MIQEELLHHVEHLGRSPLRGHVTEVDYIKKKVTVWKSRCMQNNIEFVREHILVPLLFRMRNGAAPLQLLF